MIFVTETNEDGQIIYRDSKRYLWLLSLAVTLVPVGFIGVFLMTGQPMWLLGPLLTFYGFIPLLDLMFGEDPYNPPEEVVDQLSAAPYYRVLLFCALPLYFVNFYSCFWLLGTHEVSWWLGMALVLGAGAISGGALLVGHELGHKLNRLDQWGAMIANAFSFYGHFRLEHNRGHHTAVATREDVASARMGESIYRFIPREQWGAFTRGLSIERARLAKHGHGFWTFRNELLQGYAISLVLYGSVIALWGWGMLPFLLVHLYFSIMQLTLANYVEHYGLLRQKKPDGRYEACRPCHSWNTNHIVSNLMTFHLQRHSDHHANPLRPYQSLRDFDDIPRLPSGYFGCFVLAAIPPLWFYVMDRRVMDWAGGDLLRVNRLSDETQPATVTGAT